MQWQAGVKAVSLGWIAVVGLVPVAGIVVPLLLRFVASSVSVTLPSTVFVAPIVLLPAVGGAVATRSYSAPSKTALVVGGLAGGMGGATIGLLFGILLGIIVLGMVPNGAPVNPGPVFSQYGGFGMGTGAAIGLVLGTIGGIVTRYWSVG